MFPIGAHATHMLKFIQNESLRCHGCGALYQFRINFRRTTNITREHFLRFSWGGYGYVRDSTGCFRWWPRIERSLCNVFTFRWLAGGITYVRPYVRRD